MQLGSLEAIYDICLKAYNIIYLIKKSKSNCNLPANMVYTDFNEMKMKA